MITYAIVPAGSYIEYLRYRWKIAQEQSRAQRAPPEKSLLALWSACERINCLETDFSDDDLADSVSVWVSHLYGDSTADRFHIRARLDEADADYHHNIEARLKIAAAFGMCISACFRPPISVVISDINSKLPSYFESLNRYSNYDVADAASSECV